MTPSAAASPAPRRVLVTGASRGLGFEFVRQLLARGDAVLAACRRPADATALAALAAAHPDRLAVRALELTDPASRAALLDGVAVGWGAIDVLINNAGVLASGERFGQLDAATFRTAFETNTLAPLLFAEAATPLLAKGHAPVVAWLSSVLGSIASTQSFYTPSYAVSKAALNMAARLAAIPLAEQGIRSVALHPGWVKTDMGGPAAPLEAPESVSGMLRVIDTLPADARGDFIDYSGETLPW
ncbi:SDR family oxidoreductase [Silanimonas sp.]|jgi:NAD(P)-dependent dehydrogenase (short-subunit alcohol dehydrogenase family)|uniref:SDR family oxidoreductase n=1 Tax=Silanimonas sp. TaxID=1929290 RepID=UPI0037C89BEF